MASTARRNPLMPWYIGLVIVGLVDAFVAYEFFATKCQAPGIAQMLVVVVLPGVYLALMYLTLKSQD
jgi:hypothetical protein